MDRIKITVEVVSDVVCPWCYIGKKRLEKAVEALADQYEVVVRFLPFELNPDMPPEGRNQKDYLLSKFGGSERYDQITRHVTQIALQEGLHFDFSKQTVSPNTREAHRLIWLAEKYGVQHRVQESFMRAYFEEGADLSKKENLVHLAGRAGLDTREVVQFLDSGDGLQEVILLEQANRERHISGVPFFIINNTYGISGAQPVEVLVQILTQVGNELNATGETCTVEKTC